MLNNIRKFISDIFHHIRHMFHRTHCESDCGVAVKTKSPPPPLAVVPNLQYLMS